MTRNEFRFIGYLVDKVEDVSDNKYKFYVEVEQKFSGKTSVYPIYLLKQNRYVSAEQLKNDIGKPIWVFGYIDSFENHLSLIVQEYMVLECPR